jgi:hypothetical protein
LERLIELSTAANKSDEVKKYQAERAKYPDGAARQPNPRVPGHPRKEGTDAWTTVNTKSLLGGALLGQKKYADAEPLLLAGYEGMKQRYATSRQALERQPYVNRNADAPGRADAPTLAAQEQRLAEALERLVQLYDAWHKNDDAANSPADHRAWLTRPSPRR